MLGFVDVLFACVTVPFDFTVNVSPFFIVTVQPVVVEPVITVNRFDDLRQDEQEFGGRGI